MTTSALSSYDLRLLAFAQNKRLRRFRGLLRSPRSTYCDACGSSLPSNLYGLRDMDAKLDYFVGANCMSRLSLMLVIERPYVRADIISAYVQARSPSEVGKLPQQHRQAGQPIENDDAAAGA